MAPPVWSIVGAVAIIVLALVAWTVRRPQAAPSKPVWVQAQDARDRLTSWRKLPRPFKFIVWASWVATMAAFLWYAAMYTHYMYYAPRAADPQSGHIYSVQLKSVTSFLTADEMASYKQSESAMIASWATCFVLMIGAEVWSKRKA